MAASKLERLVAGVFRAINRWRVWYRLPFSIAVANLVALRIDLRHRNVFDTETSPKDPAPPSSDFRHYRTVDGSFNDLSKGWMGMAETRFGRNAPLSQTFGENPPGLYEPNPRAHQPRPACAPRVHSGGDSERPAGGLAAIHGARLAEPRIQRQQTSPALLPGPAGRRLAEARNDHFADLPGPGTGPADEGRPATFRNVVTHWWDGSQLYGSDLKTQHLVRGTPSGLAPHGKLPMTETGHLPLDPEAADDPDPELEFAGVNGNWWIGLSAMHTLFNREHNAIVERLRTEYPDKDGEWLFQKARLINSALIVKIHATEWTTALLNSPTLRYAMRASWWGMLGEDYFKAFGRPRPQRAVLRHSEFAAGSPRRALCASPKSSRRSIGCIR